MLYGNSHELSSQPSFTTYSHPLQLILCNLWGPSHVQSSIGYYYYVSFVDAFNIYTWIYFPKYKSETMNMFKKFKTHVEL